MGFGGLPKQPRLPPEILAFSSMFQVSFKCVNFFLSQLYSYYIYIIIIYAIYLNRGIVQIYVLNHYYNDYQYECKDNKQYKNTLDLKKINTLETHLKHT